MADQSYKASFNREVMRRYKMAVSKTPRMGSKALKARRAAARKQKSAMSARSTKSGARAGDS
jgi:hypothetical protein